MENVWAYLRANKLAITVFDSYEDILDKCADAWNLFASDPGRITSITGRDWIKVKSWGRWYNSCQDYSAEIRALFRDSLECLAKQRPIIATAGSRQPRL